MKRTVTITIQRTDEITIIRPAPRVIALWCAGCAQTVPMATPEDIATLLAVQTRLIYRLVEQDKVHFVESDRGALFVCCASVAQNQKLPEMIF